MPAALLRKPDLPEHLWMYWEAFFHLQGDRQIGFGSVGPIPFTAMDRYGDRLGLEGDAFERFCRLLRALDSAYLLEMRERKPKESKTP